ncbi:MAG: PTS sugar transporter subunit IIA [Proteobacteria bacterium]|nr:PTS sugar transporter subunit IIA [Pseudomonadota bacterium]
MNLEQLIKPDSVLCNAHARSKKHCLEILSELLSTTNPEVANEEIFSRLVERERLGCTCLDKGSAFPHCRIEAIGQSSGALIKLSSPIDFDSTDGEFVDLVFGLMVPAAMDESHYADTRLIAGLLTDEVLRTKLREARSSRDLHAALMSCATRCESEVPGTP